MSVLQIAANAVVGKLVNPDKHAKLIASEFLSYDVAGAEHMGIGAWNGKGSMFDFKSCTFPAGFVEALSKKYETEGYHVHLVRNRLPGALGPDYEIVKNVGGRSDDPRYDYQMEAVKSLERYGRIIAQLATGAGKSYVAILAYSRIKRPTLFLTTRGVLMYQMQKNFEKATGVKVGVIGDGIFKPSKTFTVATTQTVASMIKRKELKDELSKASWKKDQELTLRQRKEIEKKVREHNDRRDQMLKLLEIYELVIGEEAHEASGNQYYEILKNCKNAHYRMALTATPFMRPSDEANMRLMGAFGQIGIRVSEKTLIDRGILAKPYFKYIQTPPVIGLTKTTRWPNCYELGVVKNEWRNNTIIWETERGVKYGLTTLILVKRQEHGKTLLRKLSEAHIKAKFIYGKHEQDEREAALRELQNGVIDVLIGTQILEVGVDVPSIDLVILAGGGKAEVGQRQSIGRGLREKKKGSNTTFVVDFIDGQNKHLKGHSFERRRIVEETPGFVEGILPPGEDFNYSLISQK